MMWCCVTLERKQKTFRLMKALSHVFPRSRIEYGAPPNDGRPFAVWGQKWLALETIPRALKQRRPFWQIDNGFYLPARGSGVGYYRVCYRSLSAILLRDPPQRVDIKVNMQPWRRSGSHILLALPGRGFGRAIGLNMESWVAGIETEIEKYSDRPILLRDKTTRPLVPDLENCWAVVTHSSNVAVDAVLAGIPVFVAPTSPAAPVGNLDLSSLEEPIMLDREQWWASLMAQQFTLSEMKNGTARDCMKAIAAQVDA